MDDYTSRGRPGFLGPERPNHSVAVIRDDPATASHEQGYGIAEPATVHSHTVPYGSFRARAAKQCPLCGAPYEEIVGFLDVPEAP